RARRPDTACRRWWAPRSCALPLLRPAALARPPLGQLLLGSGEFGELLVVAVLLDEVADVVDEVGAPVNAFACGGCSVGVPHAAGYAEAGHKGVVGGVCHAIHVATEFLARTACVATRLAILCSHKETSKGAAMQNTTTTEQARCLHCHRIL